MLTVINSGKNAGVAKYIYAEFKAYIFFNDPSVFTQNVFIIIIPKFMFSIFMVFKSTIFTDIIIIKIMMISATISLYK